MLAYYATSLLTAITCLGLGAFVFYKNPKNPLNRSLLRLNLSVALWSLFLFLHYLSPTEKAALSTLRLLQCAAVFIPSCYLHFIVNLLGIRRRAVVISSYILSLTFLILGFSPHFISGVGPKLNFRFYANAGGLYILWIIAYIAMSSYGVYLMLKNINSASSVKKNQIRYILLASVIGFAGGFTIYPLFYNIAFPPIGEHIIFLYPVVFTLAILKHHLLDLNIVIKRTLVYSVSVILITLVYLVVVLLAERLLRNLVGYQSLWFTVTAAVTIALLFTPLKNRIQAIADRIYVSGVYQRLKKELLEADKRKAIAGLAAGMAHEIRNPLTAIKTFAEYLPKKFDDSSFRENFSRIVANEVDKINSLIEQLLEFAKPAALKISVVDIHSLMDYTLNLLSGEMIKSNIKLIKNYTKGDASVKADPNKLKHVFFNIIKNGIEAMKGGGILTVTTSRDERFKINISDIGYGINEKDLARIFEPFYSTKEKGAGLGLAVVQSIIDEHRGSVSVKSSKGLGTTFTISL